MCRATRCNGLIRKGLKVWKGYFCIFDRTTPGLVVHGNVGGGEYGRYTIRSPLSTFTLNAIAL
jgi:hypothetical protein